MTDVVEPTPYDFRKPIKLAADVEQTIVQWISRLWTIVGYSWSKNLGLAWPWSVASVATYSAKDFLNEPTNDNGIANGFAIGAADQNSWLILDRQLAVAIINSMLGETVEAMPEDRRLTEVEESMLELAIREFQIAALELQQKKLSLPCKFQTSFCSNDLNKLLPETEQITCLPIELKGGFGTASIRWIFSQSALFEMLAFEASKNGSEANKHLEQTIRQIPMDLTVRLGATEVDISELVNLSVNDVLILDQRVSEPLTALVAKTEKFQGWTGRVAAHQAFEVSSLIANEDDSETKEKR